MKERESKNSRGWSVKVIRIDSKGKKQDLEEE